MNIDLDPCVRCGACCASLRVSFHRSQLQSEGGCVPDALADEETASTCRMRGTDRTNPRCVALVGRIGERVHCGIYEQRPDPCREFAAHGLFGIGNAECSRVRRRHGLPPLAAPEGLL
ncbi:YkgJ family cysteine cluster protein [Uliginosibacterium aquaticum]|uniref:YkgJ family cysteine cluster protein n=1 Tax=Uliginosibacterium aquaticum TaxID=2731212 RepID=A0ABX2IIW3_9RHOO|nr:YkgJ family cysteine cluster protein [Uliginosibacterium aquaticum]NSL56675.1 YkgJ family cysteine cluster protein [Uliginosibacterium aquaticum]